MAFPLSLSVHWVCTPLARLITRLSVFAVISTENGGREHHPWLYTVRQKLKPGGGRSRSRVVHHSMETGAVCTPRVLPFGIIRMKIDMHSDGEALTHPG
jgi:hypothetical protein